MKALFLCNIHTIPSSWLGSLLHSCVLVYCNNLQSPCFTIKYKRATAVTAVRTITHQVSGTMFLSLLNTI